jgi:hypothetical protein
MVCRVFKQSPTFVFCISFTQYLSILIWTLLVHPNTFAQARTVLICICVFPFGWDILSRYGLDAPGIASTWGRDFPLPSRPALGPNQPPLHWVPCLFPGRKRAGLGVNHIPPSSKSNPETGLRGLEGSGRLRLPDF